MKYTYIIFLATSLLIGSACSDNLDLYPATQQTEGTFYQNEQEIEQTVNEVYHQLGLIYNANGLPDLFGELYSDNTQIILRTGADNFGEQITNFFLQQDNGLIRAAWESCYRTIGICNNAIHQLENTTVEIGEDKKSLLRAQAVFVRALVYFNMVRAWGAIPYIDTKITPDESYGYLRVDADEIYQNLILDLTYAKENLPESYTGSDVGRITKYAASAILAKLYLTQGNNTAARTELELIINSNNYTLDANDDGTINVDDYLHLFKSDTKNSKSSILEVQYLSGINASNADHQLNYTPFFFDFHLPDQTRTFRGNGHNTPSEDLASEFEIGDPRLETSIYPGYVNLSTGEFIEYPFTMKFYDPNFENEGQNFEIVRYADILLMYAEVTQDPQYLNMVRERVAMPPFGSAGYPLSKYPTLSLAIEHERRIELCFEFHRFFDLARTDRVLEVMGSKGYDINSDKLLFPIPLNEIDINPDITQNEGY